MTAEPTGVIASNGLYEYQELTDNVFLPLTGGLCTLDSKDFCHKIEEEERRKERCFQL